MQSDNWEVERAGWTIKFKSAMEAHGGDGYYYLWIGNTGKTFKLMFLNLILDGGAKFKATAQEIDAITGETFNRQELPNKKDGTREVVKYEKKSKAVFVRFNITFL